jgi:hypothetical protein
MDNKNQNQQYIYNSAPKKSHPIVIAIIVAVVLILLIVGMVFVFNSDSDDDVVPGRSGGSDVSEAVEVVDDLSECGEETEKDKRVSCYLDVMGEDYNQNFVGSEFIDSTFSTCRDSDNERGCYFILANQLGLIKSSDPDLCNEFFESEDEIQGCLSIVTFDNLYSGDSDVNCDSISQPDSRDSCYYEKAIIELDPEICDKIENADPDPGLLISEKWFCYSQVAEKTGDGNICMRIEDSGKEGKCLVDVVIETGEISWCDNAEAVEFETVGSGKDKCIIAAARWSHNARHCNSIEDINLIEKCYSEVERFMPE